MKAAKGTIIAGLLALSYGTALAETASELKQSPQYQDYERARALLDNVPDEIRSCAWRGTWGHTLTELAANSRIAECQRIQDDYLRNQAIRDWLPVFVAVISLALAIGFRRRIAAGLYNLFVSILTLGIRVKRFFGHAIKEAADRTR